MPGIRTFVRLTVDHLAAAARSGAFWEIGGGWAVATEYGSSLEAAWVETRAEDAADLLRALVDLAVSRGVESIAVWLPEVEWLVRDARRLGFEAQPMGVYAIELAQMA